ncbi:hypothetical protein KHA94_01630 [Bacillus sp. FJAT-49705]|uniref:ABC transporter permease n=1 Tax=Cytobacillus citreus TaxID=2833586 RepID=A0ABS5NM77_9BACI|nr:hypothetical protein [Cytobacillus citreus]MBS4188920.1 hypothetical protein [Cytobacillus citreus]
MLTFVRYQLISFIRSLKFIPPVIIYLTWVFILYAYKNVPILSSYGASSIALYMTMTWISMAIFTMEEDSEKHILFTHVGGKQKYLIGKWFAVLAFMIPLAFFAIFYPLLASSFKGSMTVSLYAMAFYSHIIFGMFGILIGTLFSATTFAMKKYSWLSAVFVLVVSLASKSLIETVSLLKWGLWVFPPVFEVIDYMSAGDQLIVNQVFWFDTLHVLLYLIIGIMMAILLFLKKEQ